MTNIIENCQNSNQPFIKARKNQIDGNYIVQLDLAHL